MPSKHAIWTGGDNPAPLTLTRGDATQPASRPAVIVHVCNDVGGWGAGFVLAISKRWQAPERDYRTAFSAEVKPRLGDVQFVPVEPGLWVANMVAQHRVGRGPNGEIPLRYDAVRACLAEVATFAREHGASVHMPRIGCGLAGGKWEDIEPIVRETLCTTGIAVTVYDFHDLSPHPRPNTTAVGGVTDLETTLGPFAAIEDDLKEQAAVTIIRFRLVEV